MFFRKRKKIFGVGLSKTGISSLNEALNILGIKSIHKPREQYLREKEKGLPYFSTMKGYEGFTDFPCWAIYKELDKLYPTSKFILTVRDPESWFESRKKHYKRRTEEGAKLNWDISENSVSMMLQHNKEVKEYFKDRPADLLIINIIDGEGWEKLCPFLGKKIPKIPFPKKNVG
ncbi:MAG: sulfotransferase family protein [Candidatus Omnitrophota bacterium]|nr:MAG: sulfotransferase family protein [Candidatus Omnitrophota bacterium]